MPAERHTPLRPKAFHRLVGAGKSEDGNNQQHGHCCEYLVGVIGLSSNLMFVIGSVCFLEGWPEWVLFAGDWLFIIGSVLTFFIALWSMHEAWESKISEKTRDELIENAHFVAASLIFLVGTLFFIPEAYSTSEGELAGHEMGAWCFVAGSFGFVLATFWNALGLAAEQGELSKAESSNRRVLQLSKLGLLLSLLGSVLFVVGSVLYRPGYAHYSSDCAARSPSSSSDSTPLSAATVSETRWTRRTAAPAAALQPDMQGHRAHSVSFAHFGFAPGDFLHCLNAAEHGTWLFVIGSVFFLIQSILNLANTSILHGATATKASIVSGQCHPSTV